MKVSCIIMVPIAARLKVKEIVKPVPHLINLYNLMLALGSLQNPDMTLRDVEIIAQDPDNGLVGLSFNRRGFHLHDVVCLVGLCDPFIFFLWLDLYKDF